MKTFLPLLVFAVLLISISSCKFNNEEALYGHDCDTTTVTYAKVKPIFDNNCVGCHNSENTTYGSRFGLVVMLYDYDNAKAAANSGLLIKAVNHLPGVTPMPYGLSKLPECEVEAVTAWIHQGCKP